MIDKLYVLIVYALFGLLIALCPALIKDRSGLRVNSPYDGWLKLPAPWLWTSIGLVMLALGVLVVSGEFRFVSLMLSLGLIAVISSLGSGKFDAGNIRSIFLALCISVTIPWWRRHGGVFDYSAFELLVFGLITFLISSVFTEKEPIVEHGFSFKWLLPYALLAAMLSFSTSTYSRVILMLWHHWGAYIGSAEMLLSGAAVFHDFPVQYGLGPTTLIAGTCFGDCWRGMYFVAGFTTFLFSVLIGTLALALTRKHWPAERLIVLMLCLAACFFWTAFPPTLSSPMATPSVSGLRFLPVVLMVTYLFFTPKIEHSKTRMFIAHGLWGFGVLWSPESAFYLTCVWWPYYIFVRRGKGDFRSRFKTLITASTRLLLIAVGLGLAFLIIYHLVYHKGPTLYGYLAYALNPPGPLPINPHGGVWYFIFAVIIGMMSLFHLWRKSGDTSLFRHGFLVLLLSYSVFTYFLGRSHDNNLLNIMPFVLLVLLHAISTSGGKIMTRISVVMVAALLSWLPIFGWTIWHDNANQGRAISFEPKSFRERISYSNPSTQQEIIKSNRGVPADVTSAIEYIHQHYGEPVTVLDFLMVLTGSATPNVWSAMNGFSNYPFIPAERRREFLSATAASLHRPGWLVIDRKYPADMWLADFDAVYERTNQLEFGVYYAIRFSPKKLS